MDNELQNETLSVSESQKATRRHGPESLSGLSISLLEDIKALFWKELELLVLEVREQVSGSYKAILSITLLAGLLVFGVQLLVVAFAFYLADAAHLNIYESLALTGGTLVIVTLIGAVLAFLHLRGVQKNGFEATRAIKKRWIKER